MSHFQLYRHIYGHFCWICTLFWVLYTLWKPMVHLYIDSMSTLVYNSDIFVVLYRIWVISSCIDTFTDISDEFVHFSGCCTPYENPECTCILIVWVHYCTVGIYLWYWIVYESFLAVQTPIQPFRINFLSNFEIFWPFYPL